MNPPGTEEGGTPPPPSQQLSHRGVRELSLPEHSSGKRPLTPAPAALGHHEQSLAARSKLAVKTSGCMCHVYPGRFATLSCGRVSLETHVSTWGNPHSFPSVNSSSIPRPRCLSLAKRIILSNQLMETVNGAGSCIHNLSLVLHSPQESSSSHISLQGASHPASHSASPFAKRNIIAFSW